MTDGSRPAAELVPGRIGPSDAVQIITSLRSAYESARIHDAAVKKSARALFGAYDTLRVAWEASVRASLGADGGSSARRADLDEDAAWSALYTWLSGWAALPDHLAPEAARARGVLSAIFPDGVKFTDATYAMEWAEAHSRMRAIAAGGHQSVIESLGGGPLLTALRRAHEAYETALGITHRATMPPDPANMTLGVLAEDVRLALRTYAAAIDDARAAAGSEHRAEFDALIRPLEHWGVRPA